MMKITLIKLIDRSLGWLISNLSRQSTHINLPEGSLKKILVIRPGGIGDAALLIPAIRILRNRYPDSAIDILAEKRNEALFSLCLGINEIYCYDSLTDFITVILNKYDVVIDTEQWHRLSAITARMTSAPIRIGYATNERKKMFTHAISYSHENYERISFYHLLTPFALEKKIEDQNTFLTIPLTISEKIMPILQPLRPGKIIALFPGGSIKEKRWEIDKFREVAKKLTQRGYCAVIIGGKEDVKDGLTIVTGLSHIINLCGRLTLTETAAVLQEAELIITGDSGILHIADAMRKKIVALFGPSNVKKWAPRGRYATVITKNLDCSPCSRFGYTPRCKKNMICMKNITVEEVFIKTLELLES